MVSPVSGETISPADPRLDPGYYAYYYSQRPLDPRLPPPLIAPYPGTTTPLPYPTLPYLQLSLLSIIHLDLSLLLLFYFLFLLLASITLPSTGNNIPFAFQSGHQQQQQSPPS